MDLFNETKNKYYDIISDLIFTFYDKKKITLEDFYKLMPEQLNNNIQLKNSLLNKNDTDSLFILNETEKNYSLSIDSTIPIIPSYLEKVWLKYMLSNDHVKLFLDKETIEKLLCSLKEYEDIIDNNIIIQHRSTKNIKNYDKLKVKVQILIQAIKNNNAIKYSYKTKDGVILKDKVSIPYKIEYSLKNDKFYLISFSAEENRPIKSILENITDLNIVETETPISKASIKKSIDSKKCNSYVVLQVKDVNNAKERAFLTFSTYSKTAKYIEAEDIHELKIFYYSFEEKEVISKIFSLGKGVIVKEPLNIHNEIINIIEKTLSLYE